MSKLVFFTGVPIDDAATLYRSGLVAKKLVREGDKVIFTSVSANFKGRKTKKVLGLSVLFIGQAHYFAKKPFSQRKRLGLKRTFVENAKTCLRFSKILWKEKPNQVLVVTSVLVSLMAGMVSKILGFKTFIDIEDLVVGQMEAAGYPKYLIKIYGFFEKVAIRIFDKVSVCSHYLQKTFPGSFLLSNTIDTSLWKGRKDKKEKVKKEIVFVGQMGFYHGQIETLQALVPILRNNKNLKLIFVGGGEMLGKLKSKVKKEKLEKQVVFTGQIPQTKVRKILAEADIGILPLWESPVHQARHPLKLLEYLASGLVVVTNKVGEAARLVKDGENGILCPAGDIKCLAQKTEMILRSPSLVNKISDKAINSVREYSTEKILPKWVKFLEL